MKTQQQNQSQINQQIGVQYIQEFQEAFKNDNIKNALENAANYSYLGKAVIKACTVIDQGEECSLIIPKEQVQSSLKVATDNILQCVIVAIRYEGDDGNIHATLAHIDQTIKQEEVNNLFAKIAESGKNISISIYGGSEPNRTKTNIANANIQVVENALKQAKLIEEKDKLTSLTSLTSLTEGKVGNPEWQNKGNTIKALCGDDLATKRKQDQTLDFQQISFDPVQNKFDILSKNQSLPITNEHRIIHCRRNIHRYFQKQNRNLPFSKTAINTVSGKKIIDPIKDLVEKEEALSILQYYCNEYGGLSTVIQKGGEQVISKYLDEFYPLVMLSQIAYQSLKEEMEEPEIGEGAFHNGQAIQHIKGYLQQKEKEEIISSLSELSQDVQKLAQKMSISIIHGTDVKAIEKSLLLLAQEMQGNQILQSNFGTLKNLYDRWSALNMTISLAQLSEQQDQKVVTNKQQLQKQQIIPSKFQKNLQQIP